MINDEKEKKKELEISVINPIIGQFCYNFGHLPVIIRLSPFCCI